jgi:NADH-quinone oxidoreductase subunit J
MTPFIGQSAQPGLLGSPTLWGLLIAASGLWMMVSGIRRAKTLGALLGMAGLLLLAVGMRLRAPLPNPEQAMFWLLALTAVSAAAAAVAATNPVYTAIWFACSLLGVAGLLVLQYAAFLGVATIVVYAGAIIVTFLFVLMLAQPEGHALYDRLSWASFAPLAAIIAATGFVVLLVVLPVSSLPPIGSGKGEIAHSSHLARLGTELFSRHLVAVELAGTLLLIALVGAIAIVIHGGASPSAEKTQAIGEAARRSSGGGAG